MLTDEWEIKHHFVSTLEIQINKEMQPGGKRTRLSYEVSKKWALVSLSKKNTNALKYITGCYKKGDQRQKEVMKSNKEEKLKKKIRR